jgi:excinuclease ABC subunit C
MRPAPDLETFPDAPGVYLYKDAGGKVLYVGKALSLRKRLASYFAAGPKPARTEALLSEFATIETVVTGRESEALGLENVLIKRHRPRYNVLLKDDKTYPYIKVTTGEAWPRVHVTRRLKRDGHTYFGPFIPASLCRRAMRMVQRLFQIRKCSIEIDGQLPRPCLYYDLHACLAPCVSGMTTADAYREAVQDVLLFLSGRDAELGPRLRARMDAASASQDFEMAAAYRDCWRTVEELAEKRRVQASPGDDADVFGEFQDGGNLSVALLLFRGGELLDTRAYFWEGIGDVEPSELWPALLSQYYDTTTFLPREVLIPVELESEPLAPIVAWLSERRGARVEIRTPRRGLGLDRLSMARSNARESHQRRFRKLREAGEKATLALARRLDLDRRPERLECFDISHFQGGETYAACVVFEDGEARPDEYRAFRIERPAPDDFASIAEAVERRYRRTRDEGRRLPDLVVVDGGKGQLSAALAALDRVGLEIPAVALAKKEERIFVPGRSAPLALPRRDPALRLLQRARDEAHRFGLKHHRGARRRATLETELTALPGIGPGRARRLLRAFGSASAVKSATEEALAVASRQRVRAGTAGILRMTP